MKKKPDRYDWTAGAVIFTDRLGRPFDLNDLPPVNENGEEDNEKAEQP